jgi:multidrug efflux pump subunit AcrB
MVEEIDRRVQGVLRKFADYAPWMFAVTVVIFVFLAGWKSSLPQATTPPADTSRQEYWHVEARLRLQIDRNLEETATLLARLSQEMDRENYDAETLLAQIRERRVELKQLMNELVDLRRQMALSGISGYDEIWRECDAT